MARRDGAGVRLLTRNGHDFAGRFPLAAAAVAALPVRSCLIDGEAIVTDQNELAVFDLIRGHRPTAAVLCAHAVSRRLSYRKGKRVGDGKDSRPS